MSVGCAIRKVDSFVQELTAIMAWSAQEIYQIVSLVAEKASQLTGVNLLYYSFAFFALNQQHFYRYLRAFVPWILAAFLVYRYLMSRDGDASLLEILWSSLKGLPKGLISKRVILVLGDLLGLLCLGKLVSLLNYLSDAQQSQSWQLKKIADFFFPLVRHLPMIRAELAKEKAKLESSFDKDLKVKSRAIGAVYRNLPEVGLPRQDILTLMKDAVNTEDKVWAAGRVSGSVYLGQQAHTDFLNQCYGLYSLANPLHPDIWPSVMKFESEIIAMTASMVHGGSTGAEDVCGCTTSVRAAATHASHPDHTLSLHWSCIFSPGRHRVDHFSHQGSSRLLSGSS